MHSRDNAEEKLLEETVTKEDETGEEDTGEGQADAVKEKIRQAKKTQGSNRQR